MKIKKYKLVISLIFVVMVVSVGIYALKNERSKNKLKNNEVAQNVFRDKYSTSTGNIILSDDQIITALNENFLSVKFQKNSNGTFKYKYEEGDMEISKIFKGDLDNDGYIDSMVVITVCEEKECRPFLAAVLNQKNNTGVSIYYLGLSLSIITYIKDIIINNGTVFIDIKGVDSNTNKVVEITGHYKFQNNKLVKINK